MKMARDTGLSPIYLFPDKLINETEIIVDCNRWIQTFQPLEGS